MALQQKKIRPDCIAIKIVRYLHKTEHTCQWNWIESKKGHPPTHEESLRRGRGTLYQIMLMQAKGYHRTTKVLNVASHLL